MKTPRRCFKQSIPLKDRLAAFAIETRKKASLLPTGFEKDQLLRKARQADTASHLDDWLNSPEMQPPKL